MSLMAKSIHSLKVLKQLEGNIYEEAKKSQSNSIWKQLEKISVQEAIEVWLPTLSEKTRSNYRSGIRRLAELGLFDPLLSLQAFALIKHEAIIDQIKLVAHWTECMRQARAACYISFTGFLYRRTKEIILEHWQIVKDMVKPFIRSMTK